MKLRENFERYHFLEESTEVCEGEETISTEGDDYDGTAQEELAEFQVIEEKVESEQYETCMVKDDFTVERDTKGIPSRYTIIVEEGESQPVIQETIDMPEPADIQHFRSQSPIHSSLAKEDEKFDCPKCHVRLNNETILMSHMEKKHPEDPVQCHICLKMLTSVNKLTIHKSVCHPNGDDNGVRANPATNDYHCPICNARFQMMFMYDQHVTQKVCEKNTRKRKLATPAQTPILQEGMWKCGACNSFLTTYSDLKQHQRDTHHEKFEECPVCGWLTKKTSSMKYHLDHEHGSED